MRTHIHSHTYTQKHKWLIVCAWDRYEFHWEPNGAVSSSPHAPIKCITRQGIIGPGRQFEMVFEYTPQADALVETFWVSSARTCAVEQPRVVCFRETWGVKEVQRLPSVLQRFSIQGCGAG